MAKQKRTEALIRANPDAKKNEKVIRETLKDLKTLRGQGFGGDGYRLVAPFGDKRQLRAAEGQLRRFAK